MYTHAHIRKFVYIGVCVYLHTYIHTFTLVSVQYHYSRFMLVPSTHTVILYKSCPVVTSLLLA